MARDCLRGDKVAKILCPFEKQIHLSCLVMKLFTKDAEDCNLEFTKFLISLGICFSAYY